MPRPPAPPRAPRGRARQQIRSAVLNVMTAAAEKAGRSLVHDFGEVENLQVSRKGPADFVSTADKKAERILVEELTKARPRYGFQLEEQGAIVGEDTCNTWIIDPLDGTTNFLHGVPHFAVSIGLERDGELFAGVVYEPIRDEMFWAEKGSGAFMNGHRIRAAERSDLSECIFATGIPFKGDDRQHKTFLGQLGLIMACSAGVRRMGSAALDLCWTAAGRYDGYWETGLKAWDMAAGIVIAREAGCIATEIDGKANMLGSGSILCANGRVHRELGKILGAAKPR